MAFGINGSSNGNGATPVGAKARAQSGQPAGGATPGMAGDSLSLGSKTPLTDEIQKMTPAEAASSRTVGTWAVGGGMLAVAAAYWGAPALAAVAGGTLLLPLGLAAVGIGAALWGAMKLGKGISASLNQQITKASQGLPE